MITFIEKDSYCSKYGLWNTAKYTPVYMVKDGREFFIKNIINDDRKSLENILSELTANDGRYYTDHCPMFSNPLQFIEWVNENGYTFDSSSLVDEYANFVDFSGNLLEISRSFRFRIYDMELADEVKKMSGVKTIFA